MSATSPPPEPAPNRSTRRLPKQRPWAAILAAGVLILPLGSIYAFSVFLRPLEELLGASRSELATVFGIAAVCYTVGMNLGARLFRAMNLSAVLAVSTLLGAAGIGLSATARSFPELALGYGVLFGLGGGIGFVAMQQGVNLMAWRRPGLVNGYLVSLLPLGAMLATLAFGSGLEHFGVRATLAGTAVALLASGLLALLLAWFAGMQLVPQVAPGAAVVGAPGRAGILRRLFAIFFVSASAGLMVLSQAAGIVAAYGGAKPFALFATTGITGGIAVARLAGGWLIDRMPIPRVMAAAQALAFAGALVLTLWPGRAVSVAALLMIGMGYGVISGATAAAVACYWPKAHYGRVVSRIYVAWCAAAVTLPVLAARLFDATGGYETAILIAGAGNLIGVMTALTLPRQAGPG